MTDESQPAERETFGGEYPFASHYLDFDGVRYHYVDEGANDDPSRETLLMVHGNPTWSFAWRKLIKDLSRDFRVIAVDHIGCGFSDKPANYTYRLQQHVDNLKRLIETLDLRQVTLFGHDWGGAIGTGAAVALTERFSRIVLMNTAAFRSRQIPLRISLCRIPLLGALGVRGLNLFSSAALHMAVSKHERMTPDVCRGYLAPYDCWANRVAVYQFVKDIPLKRSHPSYATLKQIEEGLERLTELPMLLVWGEQDWCFTVNFLREFQRRFPHAETLPLPDAGHYVFEDAHEQIIPRVRQFLEEHPLNAASDPLS